MERIRLIDADKLLQEIETLGKNAGFYKPIYDGLINTIKHAPSVDAEPVRHGRWEIVIVSTSNPYESEIEEKCSLCGRFVQRYGTQPQDNYCPNCGAKMMKEVEQNAAD